VDTHLDSPHTAAMLVYSPLSTDIQVRKKFSKMHRAATSLDCSAETAFGYTVHDGHFTQTVDVVITQLHFISRAAFLSKTHSHVTRCHIIRLPVNNQFVLLKNGFNMPNYKPADASLQ